MEAPAWKGRYVVLLLDCMMGFGSYYNIDIPSALQSELQDIGTSTSPVIYLRVFYRIAVTALPGGFVIDKFGNRVSAVVSSFVSLLGTLSFAFGVSTWFRGSSSMFPLIIVGRLLLGTGTVAVRIVQDRVIAFWFPDKLEMAFGIIVSVLRIGNVLNFFITANIAEHFTLSLSAWTGVIICSIGFLASILLSLCDLHGSKNNSTREQFSADRKECSLNLKILTTFPASYWLVVVMILTFYSAFIPFVSNGCKLIQDMFGYDRTTASYYNGIIYDVPVILGPIIGYVLKKTGSRSLVAVVGALLLVTVFPLVSYTAVPAAIFSSLLGVIYTLMAISLWPSITKLVPLENLGRANGLAASLDGVFTGFASMAVGKIMDSLKHKGYGNEMKNWRIILLLLFAIAVLCFLVGLSLYIVQRRKSTVETTNNSNTVININQQAEETERLLENHTRDIIYNTT